MSNYEDDDEEMGEYLLQLANKRRYSDYWFPGRSAKGQDAQKWLSEQICIEVFQNECPLFSGEVYKPKSDPPDVGIILSDGKRVGFEVTELVYEETIKSNLDYFQGGGDQYGHRYTNFHIPEGRTLFRSLMNGLIEKKNIAIRNRQSDEEFDRLALLIVTAEPTLKKKLVEELLQQVTVTNTPFDDIFMMLSYHPILNGKGNYPVFELI